MGKKLAEAEKFIPPTEKEIMMIQPNNVTFGQYNISEWQENLLTLIADKIQGHMTRTTELPRDLFNQPYVEIVCDEAGGRNNKAKVIKEAGNMCSKSFSFRWKHPTLKKDIETTGVIITTIHDIKGTNSITVNINPWAIPFLVYYGMGVGGTRYSKKLALGLRGNYTKRIYKIICSQRNRKEFAYPIDKFRTDFDVPASYNNSQIEQKILKPSMERIKESNSDVWFDYELKCRVPQPKRKPKADTIILKIKSLHPKEAGGEQRHMYVCVERFIERAMGYPASDEPAKITEKIVEEGGLTKAYDKVIYYDDQIALGYKTPQHAYNAFMKIIHEDYLNPREKNDE